MPRPKKIPEFQEGPKAAENFRRLAERLVQSPRRVLVSERVETVETITTETQDVGPAKRRRRQK
jgi:hypothetical protein